MAVTRATGRHEVGAAVVIGDAGVAGEAIAAASRRVRRAESTPRAARHREDTVRMPEVTPAPRVGDVPFRVAGVAPLVPRYVYFFPSALESVKLFV